MAYSDSSAKATSVVVPPTGKIELFEHSVNHLMLAGSHQLIGSDVSSEVKEESNVPAPIASC